MTNDFIDAIDAKTVEQFLREHGRELLKGIDLSNPKLKLAAETINSLRLSSDRTRIESDHDDVMFLLEYGDINLQPYQVRSKLEAALSETLASSLLQLTRKF